MPRKPNTEQIKSIMNLFNRTQLDFNEEIIDNSDRAIANKLNIRKSRVTEVISSELNKKWNELNKRINETIT